MATYANKELSITLTARGLLILACTFSSTNANASDVSSLDATDNVINERMVWDGNKNLDNKNWLMRWGLYAWDEDFNMLTKGFWGYDAVDIVPDPYDPEHNVIRVKYLKDRVTTQSGAGMLFQPNIENLISDKKACLSYNMLFDSDFEFGTVGGKIPGLFGFNKDSGATLNAKTCAGPYEYDSSVCFSARLGYRNLRARGYPRTDMFYEVIPWMYEGECRDHWICNLSYGKGMVIKAEQPELTKAKLGKWTNVKQEIKVNDKDDRNGYIRIWYDNNMIYNEENITIAKGDDVAIVGILFHALFGQGFDLSQGSPTTQYSYFSDFSISDSCD